MENEPIKKSDSEIRAEIISLAATLDLPKGTEAFISDVHGDYDKFAHIMKSGAGNISQKIHELFTGRLTLLNRKKLACLIYYPDEVLEKTKSEITDQDELDQWYIDTLNNLVETLRYVAEKYPRDFIQKAIDPNFLTITENILFINTSLHDKDAYYQSTMKTIIKLNLVDDFIIATSNAIQRMSIERIHIVGDIFDRGSHPDLVIQHLSDHWQNFDFQWGNHDVLWMGSMAGSKLCMLNLIRICARYNNLSILKEAYGIDLDSIIRFARHSYLPLDNFDPKIDNLNDLDENTRLTDNCVQQAATIMQFKLEGQAIQRRPEFEMDDRLILDKLSADKKSVEIDGKVYPITNGCFQLVNPGNPYQIAHAEQFVLIDLINQFTRSTKLNEQMWFMMDHGSMYLEHNNNLLMHGCIPVDSEGNFLKLEIDGRKYSGRKLCDYFESILKDSLRHPTTGDCFNSDLLWYLCAGKKSPLFGKDKARTFEHYFIEDKQIQTENISPFYSLCRKESFANKILKEFGLKRNSHIINGHTPANPNSSPVLANGKIIVINGGLSKSPNSGGYTLLYNSYGIQLVKLRPFTSKEQAIADMSDGVESRQVIENSEERKIVQDTGVGVKFRQRIADLKLELAGK